MPPTTPVRLDVVDALRGFALLGILIVNILTFATPYYATGMPDPAVRTPLDAAAYALITLLFETKFYLLFSFLFGYSFTLQMNAAQRAGDRFAPRMLRRHAGLLLFGAAHALLLYHGDILTIYAALGIALLLVRHWTPRRAARTGAALILTGGAVWLGLSALEALSPSASALTSNADAQRALQGFTGTIVSTVQQHWREWQTVWPTLIALQGPSALAMFLLGLAAGKRQFLARWTDYDAALTRALRFMLPVGLLGAAFYTYTVHAPVPSALATAGFAVDTLTAPLLSAAYVTLFLRAARAWPTLVARLAPAGRMALSNYVLQSLACALIFHAYGLRLMGQLGIATVAALALLIYAAQLRLSAAWLHRAQYGPLEWLLRALTLWTWPPLARRARPT
ncbi:DUF418 domain-containing protein [Deinococcus maricopensis]|uniref:DUF418 domain-containing protein n=1 Tax=Deinococcus maricopensis (strain DSM 21211 / LMG 22137 / NRRL B-23946 / LB-34) TaxID=709986 RepID=E8UC28_DEIML|nr:DUF418 domain-containing protein [Deinococcus maricopensis]ADV68689.1 protein of unknown function DUF418 [Deinococcus maricopensis DSM 21211]